MEDQFKTTDKENRFSAEGKEILNPTPMQPPLGFKRQPSLSELVRQQIAAMRHIEDNEPETEEDADDFDIDDDPIVASRWENDMVPSIKEAKAELERIHNEARKYAVPKEVKPVAPPPPNGQRDPE